MHFSTAAFRSFHLFYLLNGCWRGKRHLLQNQGLLNVNTPVQILAGFCVLFSLHFYLTQHSKMSMNIIILKFQSTTASPSLLTQPRSMNVVRKPSKSAECWEGDNLQCYTYNGHHMQHSTLTSEYVCPGRVWRLSASHSGHICQGQLDPPSARQVRRVFR